MRRRGLQPLKYDHLKFSRNDARVTNIITKKQTNKQTETTKNNTSLPVTCHTTLQVIDIVYFCV